MRFTSIFAAVLLALSVGAVAAPIDVEMEDRDFEERGGKSSSGWSVTKYGNVNILTNNNGAFAGIIYQEAGKKGDNAAQVAAGQSNTINQSQKRTDKGKPSKGGKGPGDFTVVKVGNVNILTDNNGAFAGVIAQSAGKGGSNSAAVGATQWNDITQSQKRGEKGGKPSGGKPSGGFNVVKVGNVNILTDNNGAFAGVIAQKAGKWGSNSAGVVAEQENDINQSQ